MANGRSQNNMKNALFYTFLAIFAATALVTLLGITGVVAIDDFYLKGLFGALLIELVGAVIALYRATPFFEAKPDNVPLTARIDQPRGHETVERTFDCSGSATGIKPGSHLWLAVESNGFVWPREGPLVVGADGRWATQVFEDGRSPTFALGLLVAEGEGDKAIRAWLDEGSRTGEYAEVKSFAGARRLYRVEDLRLKASAG